MEDRHRRILFEESGIDPQVVAERGVRTITRGRDLPKVFSWRQRKRAPGMLFKVHRLGGGTSWVFRPDEPDPRNPGYKYCQPPKSRGGAGNVLDVHPRMHPLIDDASVPVVFVEGLKKADSLTSRGALTVGISGVWNWLSDGQPIPDMYEVPVEGRETYIAFDSDMLTNPKVQEAAERLAEHLTQRGAEVWIVYLPDQPDGSKNGADDFLAAGGTLEELFALARPFDPEDIRREKLSRSERLRRYLADLDRQHDEMPAATRAECSTRAAWRACLEVAGHRGKLTGDGVEIWLSARTGGEISAMSHMTFARRLNDLIEAGRIRRDKSENSEDADTYALLVGRAVLLHRGGGERGSRRGTGDDNQDHHGVTEARAPVPELRWPYVATVREKDSRGRLRESYEYVARLGKRRGEVVRHLLQNGGSSTVDELMERFAGEKTRPRDFRRRVLADLAGYRRQHHGRQLSVGPPIIEIKGDDVRLLDGWREALEHHRTLGGEQDAAVQQRVKNLIQRAAYRDDRRKRPADRAPTEEELAVGREGRHQRMRIERLVAEGMARHIATEEVTGIDPETGEIVDEHREVPPDEHSLSCECQDCSARAPSYARTGP